MSHDKTRMAASPVAAPWSDEEDELEDEEGDDPITKRLVFETPLKPEIRDLRGGGGGVGILL